ncbi:amidohydrolases: amidohydrolase [Rubrobacter radiotolerans]|uniref:Amidohydrolase n=1 Tax=Rubrobacter radiotolerans TaxID=42256 RepID=A0A023X7I4_RUBRA|nr:amidohydrolase [Rubrobacter radiotolerans]AHY47995.1 amidohydrolases: amidohydrolase [Rubrobacter radiotolerans]MDX5892634.1 amidohydrolase [Rubrobacter radiotolerans]SMC07969.1 hippurate hydrolase [Rubrobacter radiotolerans DSM 5868]
MVDVAGGRGAGELSRDIERDFGEKIVALRRAIHREPELGFDTAKTARKVLDALEGLPLEVETGVAQNGLVATLRGARSGPTVGLRADMDALPILEETGLDFASGIEGKMHACGHDAHTAMLVGAAHALCEMRDRLSGTVRFFFQPAEEGGGGGKVMVEEGALEGVERVFALHLWPGLPFGEVSTKAGPIMAAADKFELEVRGTGGHGAMPHLGADPIVASAQVIGALQSLVSREVDPTEPAVVTVGRMEAGSAFNVIPEVVRLGGTVRSVSDGVRKMLPERIEQLSRGVAAGMRCEADLDYTFSYPVTENDGDSVRLALKAASELFGKEKVSEARAPSMGGEDFAFMLREVPGAYVWLGVGDVSGLHTPRFDFDEAILPMGAALHVALAERALLA